MPRALLGCAPRHRTLRKTLNATKRTLLECAPRRTLEKTLNATKRTLQKGSVGCRARALGVRAPPDSLRKTLNATKRAPSRGLGRMPRARSWGARPAGLSGRLMKTLNAIINAPS